jgi:hypothetical protein
MLVDVEGQKMVRECSSTVVRTKSHCHIVTPSHVTLSALLGTTKRESSYPFRGSRLKLCSKYMKIGFGGKNPSSTVGLSCVYMIECCWNQARNIIMHIEWGKVKSEADSARHLQGYETSGHTACGL